MLKNVVTEKYVERFGDQPRYIVKAPGRVNLLGEHVDYNEGIVLPAAIDRATYLAFSSSGTQNSTVCASDLGEEVAFSAHSIQSKSQLDGSSLPNWALYPAGIARILEQENLPVPGIHAVFLSDIPMGSGLSSSASIEMAFMLAWQTLGEWELTAINRVKLGQKAENQYVGVNSGIMDQFASACGEKDKLLMLDCHSLTWRTLPFPTSVSIVIADTTIRRNLGDGEYNKRRAACERAVYLLKKEMPAIHSLRDISPQRFSDLMHLLPPDIEKRAQHVVQEISRVQQSEQMLAANDMEGFGSLMNECHASLRDSYEVSIPELDLMAETAQKLPGCYGARLTGAGFGGCTVNLVDKEKAEQFSNELARVYQRKTGIVPPIWICHPSVGAKVID